MTDFSAIETRVVEAYNGVYRAVQEALEILDEEQIPDIVAKAIRDFQGVSVPVAREP